MLTKSYKIHLNALKFFLSSVETTMKMILIIIIII